MAVIHFSTNYTMKKQDASQTLQNVLDACKKTTSTPIDDILEEKISATKGYKKYICMVIVVLMLTLCAPIPFVFFAKSPSAANYKPDITVSSYAVQDGYLYLYFDGSLIDFTSIYAVSSDGSTVFPLEYNSGTGLVSFTYDDTEWNIYVSDLNNVTVHLLLTPPQ